MADTPKITENDNRSRRLAEDVSRDVQDSAAEAVGATAASVDTAIDGAQKTGNAAKEHLNQTAEQAKRLASRGVELGSKTVDAYVEAGKQASEMLGNVNKAISEAYGRSISHYNDLSQQALKCRNVRDVLNLQSTALEQLQEQMGATTRIYGLAFDALTKSFEPIAVHAAHTSLEARETASV